MKEQGLHYHGHRERLREKLAKNPVDMPDYEILELLLAKVLVRKDTKPLAKELLRRFQSVKGALDAKPAELLTVEGFGPKLLEYWTLLRELLARYAESPLRRKEKLGTPEEVAAMARVRLAGVPHEEIWVVFLDAQLNMISWERLCKGTIDASTVYPRELLQRALLLKAHSFIMVHNHPAGNVSPSKPDLQLTRSIQEMSAQIGVRMLDHIVVTDDACYSILNDGLMF
ncbi:DNA repair protein RadC [Desulfovibrio sp. OttesenSCG-928-C06]|nr:DNA repair protein RadC [Desulfovibrio sp. OttesenSCG-928-C06]